MPAGDGDVFDNETEQGLFLVSSISGVEVEGVDHGQDAGGEVAHAAAELVVAGQLLALRGEGATAVVQVVAAALDLGGTALQLG